MKKLPIKKWTTIRFKLKPRKTFVLDYISKNLSTVFGILSANFGISNAKLMAFWMLLFGHFKPLFLEFQLPIWAKEFRVLEFYRLLFYRTLVILPLMEHSQPYLFSHYNWQQSNTSAYYYIDPQTNIITLRDRNTQHIWILGPFIFTKANY